MSDGAEHVFDHGDALRGALATLGFGACAVVVASRFGHPDLDEGAAFVAAWALIVAVVALLRGRLQRMAAGLAVVVAVVVAGPYPPIVAVVCTSAGVVLAVLMRRRRPFGLERALRLALQSSSLLAGVVVLLLQASHRRLPAVFSVRFDHGAVVVIGAVAVVVGLGFTGLCVRHLVVGGGTADPFDPPLAHCRTGPYSVLRHPMQLGQIVVVAGLALLVGSVGAIVVAAVVAAVLIGPVRRLEALQVAARFARV